MKYLGHPILGDPVYGDAGVDRLYLHAGQLEITLPGGERRVFEVPMPKIFEDMIVSNRENSAINAGGDSVDVGGDSADVGVA